MAGKKPKVTVSPGADVPESGQYQPKKGGTESTLVEGKTAPPTPKGGDWVLVDPTKHKK